MQHFVYIIKNKQSNSLYIGRTANLKKRLVEHNRGESFYTKRYKNWKLVYAEIYLSREDAIEREKRLKKFAKSYAMLKSRIRRSILKI